MAALTINAAMPSRFLKELPADVTEKKGLYMRPQTQTTIYRTPAPQTTMQPKPARTTSYAVTEQKATTFLDLRKGDMVEHTAFGKGMVLSVVKMGNDALWEIVFDEKGTKKLMAKAASVHIKKR